jgi:dipeptidyl aminopeptidase/acylaminoacyl peptidase
MFKIKISILIFVLIMSIAFAQKIPINELFYPVNDFEFTLSANGKYMASVRKFTNTYAIMITDIKQKKIAHKIPMGEGNVSNLNWLSENRISYEQLGTLSAINIDGTEQQQLMSIWKKEKKSYFNTISMLNNIQTSKMVNVLPNDFEHILVESRGIDEYPIIYKLNIYTGEKEVVEDGNDNDIDQWLVDRTGKVRLGMQNDDGEIKFFTKNRDGDWEDTNELKLDMDGRSFIHKKLSFLDFDYDPNRIFLASSVNSDKWRILSYDILKKTYVDTVLEDEKYDIGNPINEDTKLLFLDSDSKLAGIRYERDKPYTEWFNEKLKAHQDSLKKIYPEYFPDIFNWNRNADIVIARLYSDVDPGHIVIYNANTKSALFFCTYAKPLLKYNVSYTKMVKYTTRDHYEIEGYMNLPIDGSEKLPFVIIPHGGPWARDYWEYDPVVQFFANRGYGVLRMNFRGSTGYGREHLLSGVKRISTLMIDDIADGTKWLINENYADSCHIFMYGHSYGGYAAMHSIIRYPELYRAAVSIAAPTDIDELIEYYEDQDNHFSYEFWKQNVGNPSEERDYIKKISPIHNINKIKRPIYLFHGEDDGIVPVDQTKEFIEESEDIEKPFEYTILKDEDHNISENRNKEFILRKSIQFFRKHSQETKSEKSN